MNIDSEEKIEAPAEQTPQLPKCYTVQFRPGEQIASAASRILNLKTDEIVMVQTDHGLEPAVIRAEAHPCACPRRAPEGGEERLEQLATCVIPRRATREEREKYESLMQREDEAFTIAQRLIEKHQLPMKLIRVERFMNGSKIIFYFTAENRVDFRELVKDLVQEFRTRVEIRQIGVRHETKMIGGLGCCGRELCCSSFIKNFAPVSIKMAKEQGLPLNPAKISGICNRLLCCLTYEFDTYHQLRKGMPKVGKTIILDNHPFKVLKNNVLEQTIEVVATDTPDRPIIWDADQWQRATPLKPPKPQKSSRKNEEQDSDEDDA